MTMYISIDPFINNMHSLQ